MKGVFIDTNVVIDFLANRQPFSLDAAKIFNYSIKKKIKIYISALSYSNIFYILKQSTTNKEAIKLLAELSELTEIVDVTKGAIKKAIQSDFKDFEDAIQYNCALAVNQIDFIITRDTKDFRKSILPIMTPREAIGLLGTNNG